MTRVGHYNRHFNFYVRFVLGLGIVGWFYSRRAVVTFFNQLPPAYTLVTWYFLFFLFVYFVFKDVPFMGRRFGLTEALAVTMLTYAFLIVWNQVESPWAAIASGQDPKTIPNILVATEDGVTWMFWQRMVHVLNMGFPTACVFQYCLWPYWYDFVKDMTYIVTPLALVTLVALTIGVRRAAGHARRIAAS